ncbi:MAG: hypothetical protein ABI124_01705 [Terrimesophilobacter sp.]
MAQTEVVVVTPIDASTKSPVGRHQAWWILSIAGAATLAAWVRLPPLTRDTLWAEDGRNFLQGALNLGPLNSLVVPYGGYLHTLPRIVASLTVSLVPVQYYALAMTAGACILAGVMASIVFVCSADVVSWMPARIIVAMLTVLAPLAPREVLGNEANLHSLVLWTLFWVLLYRPRTRGARIWLGVFALLGSLTEIQAVLLLPLLLWRWRDRARWWPRAGLLLGVAAQVLVTVLWPRGASGNPPLGAASITYGFFINSVVPLWIPQMSIGPAVLWGGIALCLVLFLPFVAAIVVSVRFGSSTQRVAAIGLFAGAISVYSCSVMENPQKFYDYARLSPHALDQLWLVRYGVVPSMLLCALAVLAIAIVVSRIQSDKPAPSIRMFAAYAAVALVVVTLLVQFVPQDTRRSSGPAWQPQIIALRGVCSTLPGSSTVHVDETIGWHVTVPCALIQRPGW